MTTIILTLTSTDKKSIADKISRKLLNDKLCKCVNIIPNIHSYFVWKKKFRKSKEWMILIKSKKSSYKKIEVLIKKLHNYELPEIISININQGDKDYLKWVKNENF